MKRYFTFSALILAAILMLTACSGIGLPAETTEGGDVSSSDEVTTEGATTTEEVTTEEVTTAEVTTEEVTTEAATTEETNVISTQYLSLGDSIANGYGLADLQNERYFARITKEFGFTKVDSWAMDGQKSSELLADVNDFVYKDNQLITISTGANNVLGPAMPVLMSLVTNPSVGFQTLYSPAFNAQLEAGIAQLGEDLPKIIDKLIETNPDAKIVLLTVYNPFHGAKYKVTMSGASADIDLGTMAEPYIQGLNNIIRSVAEQKGCLIADVYTAFAESQEQVVNVTVDENGYITTSYDPHPNAKGHEIIASLISEAYSAAKKQ